MIRAARWSKPLSIPSGIGLNSLVSLSEAAMILGVNRRTLQRVIRRGEGPSPSAGYVGSQVWFLVQDLIQWREHAAGLGSVGPVIPTTGERSNPRSRPDWWRRGERYYKAKRRMRTGFKAEVARLDFKMKLASLERRISRMKLN
jgi:hypothetical protein